MFYIIYALHGIPVYIRGLIHLISGYLLLFLGSLSFDGPYDLTQSVRSVSFYMVE